jgi:predicted RNA-binding Zn-ribbon protein involved in translation (DUF1610 family)
MGLYNIVKVKLPCPKCGSEVDDFQTKDETFDMLYMDTVDFRTVREFHTICPNCNISIRVKIKKEKLQELTLADYNINYGF